MKKKLLITEQQLKCILKEDYPSNFSFDEMEKLTSYNKRIQYCRNTLKFLGKGSSRMAFKVDESMVLKIAINKKGIAQNNVEIKSYHNDYSNILARIFNYSDDYIFLEMELAKKVKKNDFKRLIGIDFHILIWYIINRYQGLEDEYSEEQDEILNNSDYVSDLLNFCMYQGINPTDFQHLTQWGIVIRDGEEHLVIIDYGFSEDVKKLY